MNSDIRRTHKGNVASKRTVCKALFIAFFLLVGCLLNTERRCTGRDARTTECTGRDARTTEQKKSIGTRVPMLQIFAKITVNYTAKTFSRSMLECASNAQRVFV